jgi:hypothetical protein
LHAEKEMWKLMGAEKLDFKKLKAARERVGKELVKAEADVERVKGNIEKEINGMPKEDERTESQKKRVDALEKQKRSLDKSLAEFKTRESTTFEFNESGVTRNGNPVIKDSDFRAASEKGITDQKTYRTELKAEKNLIAKDQKFGKVAGIAGGLAIMVAGAAFMTIGAVAFNLESNCSNFGNTISTMETKLNAEGQAVRDAQEALVTLQNNALASGQR